MKVFILPRYTTEDKADGGIRRVIEAMELYLPRFGIEVVDSPHDADVLNFHGTMFADTLGKPVVASCHGLYWQEYNWPSWAHEANKRVVDVLACADEITSPSLWVSKALTRGLLKRPHTIYHGVNAEEWAHDYSSYGYVLWNKARVDAVSDPTPAIQLARLMPNVHFALTTIGDDYPDPLPSNVHVIGVSNYSQMKEVIQRAGVYLATTRETFGIGTLEALAAGVPVVGWNYGGQREIILPGETGYLADPGDLAALARATYSALEERERLSHHCRADARERWGWEDKIAEYARLFRHVRDRHAAERPRVSVLVTSYNLADYLPQALESVVGQSEDSWECIVVDDASSDNTPQIGKEWSAVEPRIKYVRLDENVGLSQARNVAFSHSSGKYVIPLDADDLLADTALEKLADYLDFNRHVHIAYGHLDIIGRIERNPWPPEQFSWFEQVSHNNQLPYSSMMRREVLERSGGYRLRDWRAEDAALWCRVTSRGMRAYKAFNGPTLHYRIRGDGKSASEGREFADRDGDWTWFTPWARHPKAIPWAAQGKPVRGWWKVPHLEHPLVTVIIPVGDGHEPYLPDALDSVLAQTFSDWDVIVIDDTTHQSIDVDAIGAPYAEIWRTGGKEGPGYARNMAAMNCDTEYLLFLDADDYLTPEALAVMLEAMRRTRASYVYSDGYQEKDGNLTFGEAPDFDQKFWQLEGQIPVTSLFRRDAFLQVNGFDEKLPGWEDKDLFIRMAVEGLCGARVAAPLWVYRLDLGGRRAGSAARAKNKLVKHFNEKYAKYLKGEEDMCGCKGGSSTVSVGNMLPSGEDGMLLGGAMESEYIMLEFTGRSTGLRMFKGNNGRTYWGGNQPAGRRAEVHREDVDRLLSTGNWRLQPSVPVEVEAANEAVVAAPPQPTSKPKRSK